MAGVGEETGTLTSKFVLDVYTLTNYIICRAPQSEAVSEVPIGEGSLLVKAWKSRGEIS